MPAPPAREKRLYAEPVLHFPLKPHIESTVTSTRVDTDRIYGDANI